MRNATFTCRAVAGSEGKARTIRFVGATEDVARDGGILKMEGWQLDDYRANPVFLWAHDQKQPPIGRAVRVSRGAEGLEFDIEFAPADVYPFADLVGRLYESGFMRAVSVGFRVLQERAPNTKERQAGAQWVSEAHELLELSAVPVGADASALAAARGACRVEDAVMLRSMGPMFEPLAAAVESTPPGAPAIEGSIVRVWNEADHPRDEDGKWTYASGVAADFKGPSGYKVLDADLVSDREFEKYEARESYRKHFVASYDDYTAKMGESSGSEVRAVVEDYRGSGYSKLNRDLRSGHGLDEETSKKFRSLQETVLEAPPTKFDMVTYRGNHETDFPVGQDRTIRGFTSTSLSRVTAHEFGYDGPVLYELKIPKGSRVLAGFNVGESEVLLPHGAKVRAVRTYEINFKGRSKQVIELEYLGVSEGIAAGRAQPDFVVRLSEKKMDDSRPENNRFGDALVVAAANEVVAARPWLRMMTRGSSEQIDLMPTKGMKEEAERYRAWKAEGRQGGTEVAARRASQILSGDPMPEDAVVAMNAWFARHEVDKQGTGFSPGEEGYPSPGRVAWAAWGGDAGQSWAAEKVAALERGARPYDASGKKIKNPTPAQIAAYEEAKEDEEEKGRQEGDGAAAILEALSRDTAAVMEALGRLEAKMDVLSSILVIDEDDLDDTTQEAADAAAPAVDAPVEGSRAAATPDPYDILKKARLYAGRKD